MFFSLQPKTVFVIGNAMGLTVGILMMRWLYPEETKIVEVVKWEKAAPEIKYEDQSVTLARTTQELEVVKKKIKISEKIPGEVIRVTSLELTPKAGDVHLSIVQSQEEDGERVTVKADGADIKGGEDIFIARPNIITMSQYHNSFRALMRSSETGERLYGVGYGYDRGRFIFTADVYPKARDFSIGLGWKF
jgi:hypothetical protein